jgi:hypothetical protein
LPQEHLQRRERGPLPALGLHLHAQGALPQGSPKYDTRGPRKPG